VIGVGKFLVYLVEFWTGWQVLDVAREYAGRWWVRFRAERGVGPC
jgi:hypothetical protein